MTFEIYVFIRFISKMNNDFHRKDFHRLFFFNVKEFWHIWQRKIQNQELKSLQFLGYHENILILNTLKSKIFS